MTMAIFTERMDIVCDRMGGIQKQTNTGKMELCYDAKSFGENIGTLVY